MLSPTILRSFLAVVVLTLLCPAGFAGTKGPAQGAATVRRVLFVNSYHPGYAWSDQVQRGAEDMLRAGKVDVRVLYMDSKRKPGEASLRAAAERALAEIAAFRPDVVVAADDNAQRFLVVPHLKHGPIPVVFCGVNWDATEFGYPTRFVTGMVEMEAVNTLVGHLRQFARGDRIGFLSDESETERKIFDNYNRRFFGGRLIPYFVSTFAAFKAHFLRAQSETDMLILAGNAAISDWDDAAAQDFIARNGRVPTGATMDYMARYALVTMAKIPGEQGRWAGSRALDILSGVPPMAIPVSWNSQARLIVNLDLAQACGFTVPLSLLRAASEIIGGGRSELARSLQTGS